MLSRARGWCCRSPPPWPWLSRMAPMAPRAQSGVWGSGYTTMYACAGDRSHATAPTGLPITTLACGPPTGLWPRGWWAQPGETATRWSLAVGLEP
jgi:hypothetical protein